MKFAPRRFPQRHQHVFALCALLMLFLLCSSNRATAQTTNSVTGKVTTTTGEALPSVTVSLKDTRLGTMTNANGDYRIDKSPASAAIVFSLIGYETVEIPFEGRDSIDVILVPTDGSLDEVVVVGYGSQRKVNLSGAVDHISAKVLESRPISNIAQGLQGMVPNLNIRFNSGAPGEAANINIRGITSVNGGDPLILVDNVPMSSAELNRISPQDIESFSVIKDASAGAIYGARAAFGVILVTTKSGKDGIKISYNNNFTWNTPTVIPDKVIDPYIFSRVLQTSTDNTPWNNVQYTDQFYQYARERSNDPSIPGVRINPTQPAEWEYMGNKDWTRHFLSDWNFTQNHDMSISGASDKVQYYLSAGYNRQNSPITLADDYFDRYTVRAKTNYQATSFLQIGNNTIIGNTKRITPSQISMFDIYTAFPTSYDINPDGTWANSTAGRVSAQLVNGGQTSDKRQDVQSTFNAQLDIVKNILKLNADYTFQRNTRNYNRFVTPYEIGFGPNDVRTEGTSSASRSGGFSYYNVYNIFASYNQQFNRHNVSAILGFNQEDFRSELFNGQMTELISSNFPTPALATGEATFGEAIDKYALRGAFYRLNYNYDDKYIIELNGRYDGTSRFPKDKRFGFFPSGSAAWRLDRENFLRDVEQINLLKIRGSYGALGNQAVSNFGYIPSMEVSRSGYLIDGQRPPLISTPALVSPNYTWEKVNTINGGLDIAVYNNIFSASFDYYSRRTLGMLTAGATLPGVLGAASPRENAADLKTNGWELSINYQDNFQLAGDQLNFNARFLLSDSYSEITRFANRNNSILDYYKGMRMGEIWGLESNGFFQNEEQIANLDQTSLIPWGALSIVPGWPMFVDQDNNGVIEKGYTLGDTKDLKVIGNSTPRYQFGLDLNANWKGFDIRAFFQGVAKRDYYPLDYLYWGVYQQPYGSIYGHLLDFYRPNNDSDVDRAKHSQSYLDLGLADQNLDARFPVLQSWLADRNLGTRVDQALGTALPQTNYLLNAAYMRFKNLTVGYTLPENLLSRAFIKQLRVYFSAENLTEWSAVKRYFDPETINANINTDPVASPGREGNGLTYPFQRSFSAGVQLTF